MGSLWNDLRYGVRMLLKRPGFTLIAVITLALGIGANTTMFTIVNAILLRPLPFYESERLVHLDETAPKRGLETMQLSLTDFKDWREQSSSFEAMALYEEDSFTVSGAVSDAAVNGQANDARAERIDGANITSSLFPLLGVNPIHGRHFTETENQPKSAPAVMLSYGLWQQRFNGDPKIVGQAIRLDGQSATIVGVMPKDFNFPVQAKLWKPITRAADEEARGNHFAIGIGRLKRGVSIEQARAEIKTIAERISQAQPRSNADVEGVVEPIRKTIVEDSEQVLWLLLAVVGFVLLIACANVANLMLARGAARSREMAIRAALGAGRLRIVRQLLAESLLLSIAGAALGLLLAMWIADSLMAAIPDAVPAWIKFTLDWRVLGFTFSAAILTAMLFGLVPALQASKTDLNLVLKEGERGADTGARHRLRSALVIGEVAIALFLLIGAGLMMKSVLRLRQLNPGFKSESVLTAKLALPDAQYTDAAKRNGFYRQLLQQFAASAGIEAVALTSNLPLSTEYSGAGFTIEGHPPSPNLNAIPILNYGMVSPDYFRVMGMRLIKGREFTAADLDGKSKAVIIDETLVRQYFSNGDPIGQKIKFGGPNSPAPWWTVVGEVNAVKHWGLRAESKPSAYLPTLGDKRGQMVIVARTSGDPAQLTNLLRAKVTALDADLPLYGVRPMTEILALAMWEDRSYGLLFGLFALLALMLAAVGIYGVMSYAVTQRTHEIGVRIALGAQNSDVLRMVVKQGMKQVVLGLIIGLIAAFALTRVMESLLFNVKATDPATFVVIALLLLLVALAACWIPARRATKVDPMVALRYE